MKQKKIINSLFSNDELNEFLKNKLIHFNKCKLNSKRIDKKEIQSINISDPFCISFKNNESIKRLSITRKDIKFSLEDFDLTGFNSTINKFSINSRTNINYKQPKLKEEYKCELSDSENKLKFEDVTLKKYSNSFYFKISNNCYGLIQNVKGIFICEFKIINISQTYELLNLILLFSALNSKNFLIIKQNKTNNLTKLPIYIDNSISVRLDSLGKIISKINLLEKVLIRENFLLPNILTTESISTINSLYTILTEYTVEHYYDISFNNVNSKLIVTLLNKGFIHFEANFNVKPSLSYSLFGYSFIFSVNEILIKDVQIETYDKLGLKNIFLKKKIKFFYKPNNLIFSGSVTCKIINSELSSTSCRVRVHWCKKYYIYDNKIIESGDNISVQNKFDLLLLTDNNKYINNNISISSNCIAILSNIVKINGNLNLFSCGLKSLGELHSIKGSFSVSSWKGKSDLTCLGKLEKISGDLLLKYSNVVNLGNLNFVGGSVDLRYTNITSLGKLKCVNGRLNLRDTNCIDLGALEFVGEDLFLPKKFKHTIDISKLKVKGKVRYWKDIERIIAEPQKILGLTKSKIEIPLWKHTYIYSIDNFEFENVHQQEFFNYFKRSFFNGVYIELPDKSNYIFVLFFQLMKRYRKKKSIDKLKKYSEILSKFYPITKSYLNDKLVEIFDNQNNYEESWSVIKSQESIRIVDVIKYDKKLKRNILTPDLIFKLVGYSYLSKFGKRNINEVKKYVLKSLEYYEKKQNASFFTIFFKCSYEIGSDDFYEYYKKYFLRNCDYELYRRYDILNLKRNYSPDILHVVEKSIIHQLFKITRSAENCYREDVNLPKIGEGWIQETQLFNKIEKEFPEYEVEQHGSPDWLGRQHLDIFLPQLNVAIEFQGDQHFKSIEFFGGVDGFQSTIERDIRKKKLCKKNKCELICVTSDYDFNEIVNKINLMISENVRHND